MTSAIDPSKPTFGVAFTLDVRNNFQTAANEISALQNAIGVTVLPVGAQYDQLVFVGGAWTNQRPRYILGCFVPGVMTSMQLLLLHRVTKAITIPANFGAYLGHLSEARGTANATGSTVRRRRDGSGHSLRR